MNALKGLLTFSWLGLFSLAIPFAHGQNSEYLKTFTLTAPKSDGPLNTYAKQVFNELKLRTNIKFVIKNLPKQRALSGANMGEYDGVTMRVIHLEKDYPNLVPIKQAIFKVQHLVFSHQPQIINGATNFENLHKITKRHKYKVGFLNGSKKAKDELAQFEDDYKMALGDPMQAFGLLKVGRIDAYLAGPGLVNRQIHSLYFSNTNIQEVGVFATFPLYCYVHKKHIALVNVIEAALKEMNQDGTLQSIRNSLEKIK